MAELGWKIGHRDHVTFGFDHDPLHHVLELTDITGPRVPNQRGHGVVRNRRALPAIAVVPGKKVLDQQGNIRSPLTKRRYLQVYDIEPVEQVFPEPPLGNQMTQVTVGCGYHPDVHSCDCPIGADFPHFAGLQKAEQQALHAEAHLANLVQEYGAPLSELENPRFVAIRAGEAALYVTEQFGLEQGVRQSSAVHRDELPASTTTLAVDGPGNEFLPGTTLACNEDLGLQTRDPAYLGAQPDQCGAIADQLGSCLWRH